MEIFVPGGIEFVPRFRFLSRFQDPLSGVDITTDILNDRIAYSL